MLPWEPVPDVWTWRRKQDVGGAPGPSWRDAAASLLHHAECELVGGRLDLVLGLQVGHALGADPVDGRDDVTLGQAAVHGLAAWSYLWIQGNARIRCKDSRYENV